MYVEKEGFEPLLKGVDLQCRFDIGIMSTKGMSVTAARKLVDELVRRGVRVFALHDFDVSGFSIFGTLGTSSRRYTFKNDVQLIDVGLRLKQVKQRISAPRPGQGVVSMLSHPRGARFTVA